MGRLTLECVAVFVDEHLARGLPPPAARLIAQIGRAIREQVDEGHAPAAIEEAVRTLAEEGWGAGALASAVWQAERRQVTAEAERDAIEGLQQ